MRLFPTFRTSACLAAVAVALTTWPGHSAEPATLPRIKGTLLPIVPEGPASEARQAVSQALAEKLSAIFSTQFSVVPQADGPAIRLRLAEGPPPGATHREDYSIRTSDQGILLTGTTDTALRHAAWDLLHRLGYRQFFPGQTWEVIPRLESLSLTIEADESPDYASRRIWYGYGLWDHNRATYEDWVVKNRMDGGFTLNTGHAYGRLIRSQQAVFDAHPEYYALVNGQRRVSPEAKLCISNPGVRAAAVAYALHFFKENPDADSVSIDPSDGGNWCECDSCANIGPPHERAALLANTVAAAVTEHLGKDRFVGMYAYNYHAEPPSFDLHPNVIISTATAFIKGGQPIKDIIAGWSARKATIGIREYYSVNTWDRDLPGAARGSRLDYLAETIPTFHTQGARYLSAESSDNWGCNGLGYYFASRVLWDTTEAERRQAIVDDFLHLAFGPAEKPMRDFYERLDGANAKARLVYDDLLARLYRNLEEARTLASGRPEVLARIDDLILYTRHAELYDAYRTATGSARQAAFEAMIRHAYRIRRTSMVHSYALYRDVAARDSSVTVPEPARWQKPEPGNPWKSSTPFTADELTAILGSGVANHAPVDLDFDVTEVDDTTLVPAPLTDGTSTLPAGNAENARGARSWFTVIGQAPAVIELHITGGLIAHYRDRGNVRVRLWKLGGASATGESRTLVAEDASVPPDGVERVVHLTAKELGVYRIDLDDGQDLTRVTWPAGQRLSWKMSIEDFPQSLSGRWTLYAWVPPGTRKIGLYSAASGGELRDPEGGKALDLARKGGAFVSVDVPPGQDGRYWKFYQVAGRISLLNLPPFLARTPAELVIPQP